MGERFGNYELKEKLAVGGMAEIFKAVAVHDKGVEKLVCIKRIHPALSADKTFVAMFIDEARLGVSLVHNNIVPVFDFGYVDGHYYLAMEYVDGINLATLNGRSKIVGIPWPPQLVLLVMMEILEGLSYAHGKKDSTGRSLRLVHRDVSLSNVLVSNDGQVKLLDFGIASSQAREFETRTGVIKGKPGYMSPEQAVGGAVDSRADIWSCGSVLYELCTGAKLKDGRRRSEDPLVEKILDRALATDPEDRYSTAVEMQQVLADVLATRGWRPYARDLASFVRHVRNAAAPGENWDMTSTGVEKHLSDALKSATAETEPLTELVTTTDHIHGTGLNTRTFAIAAAFAIVIAVAIFLLITYKKETKILAMHSEIAEHIVSSQAVPSGKSQPDAAPDAAPVAVMEPSESIFAKSILRDHIRDNKKKESANVRVGRNISKQPPRRKKALLHVNTEPWSQVTLDGKSIGQTPIREFVLSPGRHEVILTNPVSKVSETMRFRLKPGEEKKISKRLTPKSI